MQSLRGGVIYPILESLFICGVNLFILISGWYGIHRVFNKALKLFITCLLVGVLCSMIGLLSPQYQPTLQTELITLTGWHSWFIREYAKLMIVSPVLEFVISKLKRKMMPLLVVIFTIGNVLFCHHLHYFNNHGYSFINFVYLYLVARTLKLYIDSKFINSIVNVLPATVIVACIVSGFAFHYANLNGINISSHQFWAYNSPLVLFESFAIFTIFAKNQIQYSSIINKCASCTLVIYLLHSNLIVPYYRNIMTDKLTDTFGILLGVVLGSIMIYLIGTLLGIVVNYASSKIFNQIEKTVS